MQQVYSFPFSRRSSLEFLLWTQKGFLLRPVRVRIRWNQFWEVIGWDETNRHPAPVALAYRTLFVRSWRQSFRFVTTVVIVPATCQNSTLSAKLCLFEQWFRIAYYCAVCAQHAYCVTYCFLSLVVFPITSNSVKSGSRPEQPVTFHFICVVL